MSQGEYLISILLGVIAYFLYQIVRQLTFITGRKMKSPFSGMFKKHYKPKLSEKEEKMTN